MTNPPTTRRSSPPPFAAAIFDLDGVLVDTARYHFLAWRVLAREYGIELDESVAEAVKGVGRTAALDIVLGSGGINLPPNEAAEAAERKNRLYQQMIGELDSAALLPGAETALRLLRGNGVRVGLASASRNARPILQLTGIEMDFDVIVDGTIIDAAKPDPAVFLKAASQLGVDPLHSVVFEDAAAGIDGAKRAGCYVVGIGASGVLAAADAIAADLTQVPWTKLFHIGADQSARPQPIPLNRTSSTSQHGS